MSAESEDKRDVEVVDLMGALQRSIAAIKNKRATSGDDKQQGANDE